MENRIVHKDENMKCPLCGAGVKKVIEADQESGKIVKCENEFYRHYGDSIIKFITPRVNPPEIRFRF
jgi:uncharacterized protein (DUF2225 family)